MTKYNYRLVFPSDGRAVNNETAHITSDRIYQVGDEITHRGELWTVTQAPVEQPDEGETADLLVWPAG